MTPLLTIPGPLSQGNTKNPQSSPDIDHPSLALYNNNLSKVKFPQEVAPYFCGPSPLCRKLSQIEFEQEVSPIYKTLALYIRWTLRR